MNRRDFLKAGAAAGMTLPMFGAYVAGAQDQKPLRVGMIGSGWYGKCDILRLIQVAPVEIVSLCDVDKKMVSEAADIVASRQKGGKKPRTYTDYREMLKEKDLDIVEVSTPDHWHALAAIAAMEAGADLYLQKPISVDIAEGQAILATARKLNRVVQVGTQRRSTPHLVEARDKVIKEGLLGQIGLVEIYCYYHMRARQNPAPEKPPENLDYELWTGPAPMLPYTRVQHPRGWRAFMEYGNGIIGDMCIHMLDTVRWMLGLGWPKTVSSNGGIFVQKNSIANISDTQEATFAFDGLPVVWTHRTWGHSPDPKYPWGMTFYGDKGMLKASVNSYDFYPQGRDEPSMHGDALFEYEKYPEDRDEKDLERHVASAIRRHWLDLLKARETRGRPVADVEQGYISTASCVLANMSMKLGRTLAWDEKAGRVANDPEANRLLARPYRSPWVHPGAATA